MPPSAGWVHGVSHLTPLFECQLVPPTPTDVAPQTTVDSVPTAPQHCAVQDSRITAGFEPDMGRML